PGRRHGLQPIEGVQAGPFDIESQRVQPGRVKDAGHVSDVLEDEATMPSRLAGERNHPHEVRLLAFEHTNCHAYRLSRTNGSGKIGAGDIAFYGVNTPVLPPRKRPPTCRFQRGCCAARGVGRYLSSVQEGERRCRTEW